MKLYSYRIWYMKSTVRIINAIRMIPLKKIKNKQKGRKTITKKVEKERKKG